MWKLLFSPRTLKSGEKIDFINIRSFNVLDQKLVAEVEGTYLYDIEIDKKLNMTCTCPQGIHYGRCKHMVSVLLRNDICLKSGYKALIIDYSDKEAELLELKEQQEAYNAQLEEQERQRQKERERQEEEKRLRYEKKLAEEKEAEERRKARELKLLQQEKKRLEKETCEEELRKSVEEWELRILRQRLSSELKVLGFSNFDDYSIEQLKSMHKEHKQDIKNKLLEREKTEKAARAFKRQEELRMAREEKEWQRTKELEKEGVSAIKKLKKGEKFNVTSVAALTSELFDGKIPYRTYYFKPKALQKFIRGGFYIWIIAEEDGGWIYDQCDGLVWKISIDVSRNQIERLFIGNRNCLTGEIMDMHGYKILVFLDRRKRGHYFEFFGVFGEQEVIFSHNEFKGITYIRLFDDVLYEMPTSQTDKTHIPKRRTLKRATEEKRYIEYLMEGTESKFPEHYQQLQKQLKNLNVEIAERQKHTNM